jgi:oligopeptide transport system ATP-binding protein
VSQVSGSEPILKVEGLKKFFPIRKGVFSRVVGHVKAVDGVNFTVNAGETLGVVGESGCGKTTAGRTILRLIEPTAGTALFEGKDIFKMGSDELRLMRQRMQIIFQDPYSSLNPRLNVETIIGEPLKVHDVARGSELRDRVANLLERVGLLPTHMGRFPHEFSGGQRQRIGIARALALEPRFIVCDEAVSALDVSIQAQVINILQDLQDDLGLSYLFIAHDLSVVRHISTRVAVMYLGRVVELSDVDELYEDPRHPYTQALLSAIPVPVPRRGKKQRIVLTGDVPNPINPPPGCHFHPRCPYAMDKCRTGEAPPTVKVSDKHEVACHLVADGKEPPYGQ